MKKLVLGALSLALVTTAMGNTAPKKPDALAPSLQISGNTIMNAYAVTQHRHQNYKGGGHHFANDVSDLFFLISGRTASGIEYKYKINFNAVSNDSPVVDQNYIEFVTKWGTVQFGNVVGPEDTKIGDAGSIVGGTGAFDGSYYKVFNFSAFAMRGNDVFGDTGFGTKIVYYTPDFCGFSGAVAYTPQTTHLGDDRLDRGANQSPNAPGQRHLYPRGASSKRISVIGLNNWAFGLSYKKQINNWGIDINGAYVTDKSYLAPVGNAAAKREKLKNTSAYQLGTIIGYRMQNGHLVQVAGGYLNNGKSRLLKRTLVGTTAEDYGFDAVGTDDLHRGNTGSAYNLGAAYVMGAYKFSGAFQNMERKVGIKGKARTRVGSVAVDVVPVAGLKFYGEVNHIRTNSTTRAVNIWNTNLEDGAGNRHHRANRKNIGTVFILGSKISF